MRRIQQLLICTVAVLLLFTITMPSFSSTAYAAGKSFNPYIAAAWAKSSDNVNNTSGKCANFVRWALYNGGLTDITSDASNTNNLRNFVINNGYGKEYAANDTNLKLIMPGDIVEVYTGTTINHVIIVTEVGDNYIKYSARNNNHCDEKMTFATLKKYHTSSSWPNANATKFIHMYNTAPNSEVVANSITFNNHIYERYDYHLTWEEAKVFCESKGGHLVTITDAAEQNAILGLLSGCPLGIYHIGCKDFDLSVAFNWGWVTGESFSYDNWDPQAPEPNSGEGASYGAIIGYNYPKNKQVGEWIDDPNTSSKNFYSLDNFGFICEYDADTTPPTISDVSVTDVSPTGYTVTCRVSDDKGVARVSFPTWYANEGQTLWRDGTIANGIATFRVNVSDHNGVNGCTYVTHIYAYDDAGNVSSVGDGTYSVLAVSVPTPDTTEPTISDVTVTDISPTGYTVTCRVSDNTGIAEVRFPTWTLDIQDDLANPWPLGTLSNGTASFHVNVSDHNGENACTYRTHIYAYDLAGNISVYGIDTYVPGAATAVVFDANGGTGAPEAQQKQYGIALTLSAAVPQRTGFTFLGWAAVPTAAEAQYQPGGSYTEDRELTLYAVWQLTRYDSSLALPAALSEIGTEAFAGAPMQEVAVPAAVQAIGSAAFANCGNLRLVMFSSASADIAADAFPHRADLVFCAPPYGSVQSYAERYGLLFVPAA